MSTWKDREVLKGVPDSPGSSSAVGTSLTVYGGFAISRGIPAYVETTFSESQGVCP